MPDEPQDLNQLLARLRQVSLEHGDPRLPQDVPAQAWMAQADQPRDALQDALIAGVGKGAGLSPYLVVDDTGFALLSYQCLLGRAPDAEGRAFLLERLRLRTPRTELMAEMVLSSEARQHGLGNWHQRLLSRLLHLALHPPLLRTERVVRAVLRRVENRLARRATLTPFGLSWRLARAQDANARQLHAELADIKGTQADLDRAHMGVEDAMAGLKAEHLGLKAEHLGLKAEHARLKDEHDGLKADLDGLKDEQASLNADLDGLKDEHAGLNAAQAGLKADLTGLKDEHAGLNAAQAGLKADLTGLKDEHAGLHEEHASLKEGLAGLKDEHAGLNAAHDDLKQAHTGLQEAQAALRKRLTDQFVTLQLATVQNLTLAPEQIAAVADYFAAFEAHFRGPVTDLRSQLEADYMGRLIERREEVGDAPCLDLGCGRGVWLGLLRDHGFSAQGVDLNTQAVADAQKQGLNAQFHDALQWLRTLPGDSALAITAFHLMEHLPFSVRLALVAQCARVLKPGGLLILETPNPENVWVSTHTFYHDPTHSQPLTPDSLEFLVNYHGLETVEVARLHPYPESARLPEVDAVTARLNNMTCAGQDFVVIARKPV